MRNPFKIRKESRQVKLNRVFRKADGRRKSIGSFYDELISYAKLDFISTLLN